MTTAATPAAAATRIQDREDAIQPRRCARAIAPAPTTTPNAAARAPLRWPWCHWTTEPTVNARTMLIAARTTARRPEGARAAGEEGCDAGPQGAAGRGRERVPGK